MAQVPPCPACQEDLLTEPTWACDRCATLHHRRCFEHGGCAAEGCGHGPGPSGVRREVAAVAVPALLGALAVVTSLVLPLLPGVEVKSILVFVAGMLAGRRPGVLAGLVVTIVQNVTRTAADPVTIVAQAVGFAGFGLAGGLVGVRRLTWIGYAVLAIVGTSLFQVWVNLAFWWVSGVPGWVVVAQAFGGGLPPYPFTPVHIAWNAVLFAMVLPPLRPALARMRSSMGL